MEFQLHVILLIVCSMLLAWCWRRRGLSSPTTVMLALCVAFVVRLIAQGWRI